MLKYIKMMMVLSGITFLSGLALGALNEMTYQTAENNILKFKKIPAVTGIYEVIAGKVSPDKLGALEETLLAEKKFVDLGEKDPTLIFVIKKNDKPYAIAFEKFGQGFGGLLGVMVGYKIETGALIGIGITTLSETPGVGTRVKEVAFTNQFQKMNQKAIFKIKKDGGDIDAIGGATISSRAVAHAIFEAKTTYDLHRLKIQTALSQ